ncbi:MAG: hypothetical protein WCL28_03535 [bacterium]
MIYSLLCVVFAASFFSAPAFSGVVENVNISIPEWVKASKVNAKLNAAGVPRRVGIVKRVDKNYVPVNFDFDSTSLSYLDFGRFEQNQLTFEINKVGGVSRCSSDLAAAARCLEVDLVLDVSRSTWTLSLYDRQRNKLKNLTKGPAGNDTDFVKWISAKLNYDGVILDQKNNYRLALVPPTVMAGETQVLLLDGSAATSLVEPGAYKGSGLFLVKKVFGRYAILDLIISEQTKTSTKLGDKIIIDRSQKAQPVPPGTGD